MIALAIGLFYGVVAGALLGLLASDYLRVQPLKQRHASQMNGLRTALLAEVRRGEERCKLLDDMAERAITGWENERAEVVRLKGIAVKQRHGMQSVTKGGRK